MFNIKFMGKYKDEKQLIRDHFFPTEATQYKETNSIMGAFLGGLLCSLPLMIPMTIILILNFKKIITGLNVNIFLGITIFVSVLSMNLLMFLHEIIHAILFPKTAKKEIWTAYNQGALFVYCTARVSKIRFIVISLAPAILLGVIPFGIWMLIYKSIPTGISICFAIISWIMTISSVGDFYNVYNTILQVPKDAKVFNHGFHTFWVK